MCFKVMQYVIIITLFNFTNLVWMLKILSFCAVNDLLSYVSVYGTLLESISVPRLIKKFHQVNRCVNLCFR